MLLVILKAKNFLQYFTKKIQRPNQRDFRVEKVINRKSD